MTRNEAIATLQKIATHYQSTATDVAVNYRHMEKGEREYSQAVEAAKVVTAAIAALAQLGALK